MNELNPYQFTIYKQTKVLIDDICNPERLSTLNKEKINADIAMSITEIIAIYMRNIAKLDEYIASENKLVDKAVAKAKEVFQEKLATIDINYDIYDSIINKYLEIAKKTLTKKPENSHKYSFSKSILETKKYDILQGLDIVENNSDTRKIYSIIYDELSTIQLKGFHKALQGKKINLTKIGFDNYIEGLLIYPELNDLEYLTINIADLPLGFNVPVVNHFPIEIYHEDYIYILDDDGSIFVNVENLTGDSFLKVGQLLIELAMALYD